MKISSLAYKNLRGNFYKYMMYTLSNSLIVGTFFIFANFIFNPSIDFRNLGGHAIAAMGAVFAVVISEIIILIFAVLFIGYSTAIFLKSRGKEFGILSLYGMTKKDIRKYVARENILLSLISIFIGIFFASILSGIFLIIMGKLIDEKLAIYISFQAIGLTSLVFFILFQASSYIMLFRIKDREIVDEIKSSSRPREMPNFSKKKAITGIILLFIAYIVAWFIDGILVPLAMIPVTIITIVGTYFFFTQASIYLTRKLKEVEGIKYNKISLITSSQLIFKLKDTARLMFLASILLAISLTATESILSFYTELDRLMDIDTYEDFSFSLEAGRKNKDEILSYVRGEIGDKNLRLADENIFKLLKLENLKYKKVNSLHENILVISQDDYKKTLGDKEELSLEPGQAKYFHEDSRYNPDMSKDNSWKKYSEESIVFLTDKKELSLELLPETFGINLSTRGMAYEDLLVLNELDFKELYRSSPAEGKIQYINYSFKKSKNLHKDLGVLEKNLLDAYNLNIYNKIKLSHNSKVNFKTILFIGFFISFIFIVASGSMIYFKLFNEIKEDEVEYKILYQIGMCRKDIYKIIARQIDLVFLLPYLVGVIHSIFAFKSLSNLLGMKSIKNALTVYLFFLLIEIMYLGLIKRLYIKKLNFK